jgi:5-methylcytosine-specific restriction endonuclease McrA
MIEISVNKTSEIPSYGEFRVEFPNGTIAIYKDNRFHYLHGPAVIKKDGTKKWFRNGTLHRPDGPAVEFPNGDVEFYLNGFKLSNRKLHRYLATPIRLGIFPIKDVLPFIGNFDKTYRTNDGHIVNVHMDSMRYKTFNESLSCCVCGVIGEFFSLEGTIDKPDIAHFNLYAVDHHGREVLMTKDHIIPKSKGGSNYDLSNFRTMCLFCNNIRADNEELSLDEILEMHSLFGYRSAHSYAFPTPKESA